MKKLWIQRKEEQAEACRNGKCETTKRLKDKCSTSIGIGGFFHCISLVHLGSISFKGKKCTVYSISFSQIEYDNLF